MSLAILFLAACGGGDEPGAASSLTGADDAPAAGSPSDPATPPMPVAAPPGASPPGETAPDAGSPVAGPPDSGPPDAPPPTPTQCACASYTSPVPVGALPATLPEISGLAASRKNAGVLYAHNDSGDGAHIFALDHAGRLLGEIALGGATARDYEDLAVGPCETGDCVFIADVGNNSESRTDLALYAIDEPALDGQPFATKTIAARRYPFSYPDGSWNCEAMLVHPKTGEIYIVTKSSVADAGVYRYPGKPVRDKPVTLEKVGAVKGTKGALVTGADISACGDRVLIRTYGALLEYAIAKGTNVAQALGVAPRTVPVAAEAQGEAVAFRADARGYFTASEGKGATLSLTGCR